MNRLAHSKRVQMLSCLVDGCSMEATARIVHVAPNTVAKFLVDLGKACTRYQARVFENIFCKRIQCDEIWSFVGCKEKNVTNNGKRQGDTWTWIACDPDTKLVPCWFIGRRDSESAKKFMRRLARHLSLGSTQITTDGLKAYINAIKEILWIEPVMAWLRKNTMSVETITEPDISGAKRRQFLETPTPTQ